MEAFSAATTTQPRAKGIRALYLAPGLLIVGSVLGLSPLRSAEGWPTPLAWTLVVVGLSVSLLGGTWGSRWQRSAGLFALALVGQACSLQLLFAPPYGVYQHYLPWKQLLTSPKALFLVALLVQTVLVAWLIRPFWPRAKEFLSRQLGRLPTLIFLAFLCFAGVKFTEDLFQYGFELVLMIWTTIVSVLNLMLVAAYLPGEASQQVLCRLKRFADRVSFPWLAAAWVTLVSAALAWFIFEAVPHIPDSVSYLFQAKYFAAGKLYLGAPPDAGAFNVQNVINDGTKWYGYGFPGWPAVLALGVLAGLPWLVNPLLGGLTVLLGHALLSRLYDRRTASVVVSLLAVSPWFLFMSASFMAHPLTIVWSLLSLLAVEKERRDGRGLWAIVAGLSLGALLLTRPIEGVLVGMAIGVWALGMGTARLKPRAIVGFGVAAFVVASLALPYTYALTGDALYPPHMKWADEVWYPGADRLGFGADIGNVGWPHLDPLPGHGPFDVLINANSNFFMSNFELFGWSFGSLLFAALVVLLGAVRRSDWVFCAIILAIVAGHCFYWSSGGPDFGARYWYQALVPFVVLTVRGVQAVQQRLRAHADSALAPVRVAAFVAAAALIAAINIVPWRSFGKYVHYRGMSAHISWLVRDNGLNNDLIFVREKSKNDYASAFIFNPPTLDSPGTIYAKDTGAAGRAAVARNFPNRTIWIIAGSDLPGGHFQLVAGPLRQDETTQATRHQQFLRDQGRPASGQDDPKP